MTEPEKKRRPIRTALGIAGILWVAQRLIG
jgi:hypothetical protein